MTAVERSGPPLLASLARLPQTVLLTLIGALALTVLYGELPSRPVIFHVIEKLGHPGVFAIVSILALAVAYQRGTPGPAWREYAFSVLLCALLGAATELGQNLTHRSPSLRDVGLDLEGAVCALAAASAMDGRLAVPSAQLRRGLGWCAAAALAVVITAPLFVALAAYANRAYLFPVLFAPRTASDLYFLEAGHQSVSIERGALADRPMLRVLLRDQPFAGIALAEPSPDWRAYRTLHVEAANPGDTPLTFNVRVDDAHRNEEYADRYNGAFTLEPRSRRTLDIPLTVIASAPRDRVLDLGKIAAIVLFRSGAGPSEFDVERVELR